MYTTRYLQVLQRLSFRRLPVLTQAVMATAEAIPMVRGAVICLTAGSWRVPVAVSDAAALRAEQWAYTVGDRFGPAPAGPHNGHPAERAVPLHLGEGDVTAVLLLYFDRAGDAATAGRDSTDDIASLVGGAVADCLPDLTAQLFTGRIPGVASTAMIAHRTAVNVAVGMVMADQEMTAADAMDLLRAYSWSRNTVVDDTAMRLRTGTLALHALR